MMRMFRTALEEAQQELGLAAFVAGQRQQFLLRMAVSTLFLAYLAWHAPVFSKAQVIVVGSWAAHIAFALACLLLWLSRSPSSVARTLIAAAFDIYMIGMAATVDGGLESPLFAFYFSPIIGNGMRYGLPFFLFCALLSSIAILMSAFFESAWIHTPDWQLLPVEIFLVLYISFYTYLILARSQHHFRRRLAAEEALARVIEHGTQPTFVLGADNSHWKIKKANAAWHALTGGAATDQRLEAFVAEDDRPMLRAAFLRALRLKQPTHAYLRILSTEDDTPVPCIAIIAPIEREEAKELIVFLADIGESQRVQRAEMEAQKAAYTAALAAGVAHDFRNLLTTIIGEAELVLLEDPDLSLRRKLEVIIDTAEQGASLINQLLRFGRDTGQKQLCDLAEHLPEMAELLRVRLAKGIRLLLDLDPYAPKVRINPAQIQQALFNLVDNAAYALNGKGTITIRLKGEGKNVLLEVEDDGPGIPPEQQARLFQPFSSSHPEDGGTGLGLLMVQRIAHWHGGRVQVASKPGASTRVRITLPSAEEADQPIVQPVATPVQEAAVRDERPLAGRRVLVVDDEAPVLRVHKAMLQKAGAEVIAARNGEEALELLEKHEALDAAVLDYMMPGMDGLTLARALRKRIPHLPITILTGYGDDEALLSATQEDISIVDKPIGYQRLVALVQRMGERR